MSIKGCEVVKIKELLQNSNLTLAEVSRRTGMKYNTLWYYKSGKRNLSIKAAKKLATVLGIDWKDFFDEE